MYELFGFKKKRVNLLELLQPKESCITKAQVTLYELLVDFHTAATAWLPVSACGASFGDSLLRRDARAQLLQVSAGIVVVIIVDDDRIHDFALLL